MPNRPGVDLSNIRKQRKQPRRAHHPQRHHTDRHMYVNISDSELLGQQAERLHTVLEEWSPERARGRKNVFKSTAAWLASYAASKPKRHFDVFEQSFDGATTGLIIYVGATVRVRSAVSRSVRIVRTLVAPRSRSGSGTALLDAFVHRFPPPSLFCVEASQCTLDLHGFYAKCGFVSSTKTVDADSVLVLERENVAVSIVSARNERRRLCD